MESTNDSAHNVRGFEAPCANRWAVQSSMCAKGLPRAATTSTEVDPGVNSDNRGWTVDGRNCMRESLGRREGLVVGWGSVRAASAAAVAIMTASCASEAPEGRSVVPPRTGPPISLPGTGEAEPSCTGEVAAGLFRFSVCSCEHTNVRGFVHTSSWSSRDRSAPVDAGASVGSNRGFAAAGFVEVGGSLFVAQPSEAMQFAGHAAVFGEAAIGGPVEAAGYIRVLRDLRVDGSMVVPGFVEVGGDLRMPLGSPLLAVTRVEGERVSGPVRVDPPCPCEPGDGPDTVGLVAAAATQNDNDAVGLDPDVLSGRISIGDTIVLPGGSYYVRGIRDIGAVQFRITGPVALFVDGDVNLTGAAAFVLEPGAELDIFIAGDLRSTGAGLFGDPERPADLRVYVAGSGDIDITGAAGFAGNLYAPRANAVARGALFVEGSIVAKNIEVNGALTVRFDRTRELGDPCPPEDPPTCAPCDGSCATGACVDGSCGVCRSNADCCEPYICIDGECDYDLI